MSIEIVFCVGIAIIASGFWLLLFGIAHSQKRIADALESIDWKIRKM